MSELDFNSAMNEVLSASDWEDLKTRDKVFRVADVFLRFEGHVPSWTKLREFTHQGSAGTIQKARTEFLSEHAKSFRSHGLLENTPRILQQYFLRMWSEAIAEAGKTFESKEADIKAKLESAQVDIHLARQRENEAREREQSAFSELRGLQVALEEAKAHLENEKGRRHQAEKLVNDLTEASRNEKDRLESALAEGKEEIRKALQALEGVENLRLREVSAARKDRDDQVSKIHESLEIERARSKDRELQLQSKIDSLNAWNRDLAMQHKEILAERDQLKLKLAHHEETIHRLSANEGKLQKSISNFEFLISDNRTREARLIEEIDRLKHTIESLQAKRTKTSKEKAN